MGCLSAVLLSLSFPSVSWGWLAWAGLVPLFLALRGRGVPAGFCLSYFCGIIFLLITFRWIFSVGTYTHLHHVLLALYLGFYFALFGALFAYISSRWRIEAALAAAPFLWVSLEYIRSNLSFLALPWMLLSHSQYEYPVILQVASITGAWGLSFLIVLVNAGLFAFILPYLPAAAQSRQALRLAVRGRALIAGVSSSAFIAALLYGWALSGDPSSGGPFRVSVVQGNISQEIKWDWKYANHILDKFAQLTEISAQDRPDLIVWPEAATPAALDRDPRVFRRVVDIAAKSGSSLLLGSTHGRKFGNEGEKKTIRYNNSAILLSPRLAPQKYDKIILFPFGEYLPHREILPWHWIGAERVFDYLPGDRIKVFSMPGARFGATICWENMFPDLVRRFVQEGAQFIVNITNEARFGETTAPHQFLSMSVMRAVENRVYVVRCANTGISCFIDPYGRIVDRVKNETGSDVFVTGVLTGPVFLSDEKTIYTVYGDWFVLLCFFVSGAVLLLVLCRQARASREAA